MPPCRLPYGTVKTRPSEVLAPAPAFVVEVYATVLPSWLNAALAAALASPFRASTSHPVPCVCEAASRSVQMIWLCAPTSNIVRTVWSPFVQWARENVGVCWFDRPSSAWALEEMKLGMVALPSTVRISIVAGSPLLGTGDAERPTYRPS